MNRLTLILTRPSPDGHHLPFSIFVRATAACALIALSAAMALHGTPARAQSASTAATSAAVAPDAFILELSTEVLNTVKADTVRIDQVVEGMRADVSELKVSQAQLASDLRNHMNSEERRDAAIVDAINELRQQL